ncbi:hypothetical protein Tco_1395338 [Tanacetum coccineum]
MDYLAKEVHNSIVLKLQRELEAERTLAHQLLCNLTRYSEEMSIREVQITMLQSMPTMSLNSYGLHALLMAHEADIRTTNNIIRTRQEFNPNNVRLTVLTKLQEALDEEAILEQQILDLMHRFADRFTDRADMKNATYLESVRDELLRSMEEKRQLMANYQDM